MTNGAAGARGAQRVNLAQVSLPRLLFALLRQRFTGTMTVQQAPPHIGNRTVWFRGGMPVYTDWVAPASVLGQVLVNNQMIDEDQLLAGLEAMAADGGLLGEHLMEQGALDRPRLLEGLRLQMNRKLVQLFALRGGEAHVAVGTPEGIDADLLPVNVLGLVAAGVGALYDEGRISDELGTIMESRVQATSSLAKYLAHFRFRPGDEPIVGALQRGTSLAQLTATPGVAAKRAMQLIYTLWACQMLRASGGQPGAARPAAAASSQPQPSAPPPEPASAPPSPAPAQSAAPQPKPAQTPTGSGVPAFTPATGSAPLGPTEPPRPAATEPKRKQTLTDIEAASDDKPPRRRQITLLDPMAAASAADYDDEEDPFVAELEALEKKVEAGAHPFELFGIEITATKRDVRRAWSDLSRKFHPDAQKNEREALRDRVGQVFAALSEAQQLLNDAEQRDKLRESIEKGEHEANKDGKDATAQAHAVFQSELLAKEADKLLRGNRFDRALEGYREAATYNADEPDILAAIAWCEYQTSGKGPEDSLRAYGTLTEIVREYPNISRAHYFLGFVLTDQGNPAAAIDSFEKASKLDPRLIDAERQTRALKMKLGRPREAAKKGSGDKGKRGGLRGLFGKK